MQARHPCFSGGGGALTSWHETSLHEMRLVCLYNPNTSQIFRFCNMHDGNRLQMVAMGQMPPVGVMQKSAKALLGISQHSLTTGLVKEMQQKPNTGSPETCKWETGKVKGMIQNL